MKVIKPSSKKMIKKAKELTNQENYMLVLSDSKNMDNKMYVMNFFKHGSTQFQRTDSEEKHPNILKGLKESLDINF